MLSKMPSINSINTTCELDRNSLCLMYAKAGFQLHNPDALRDNSIIKFFIAKIETDFSSDSMEWYEDFSLAVSCYSSFVFGGMVYKFMIQTKDERNLILYDFRLAGYNMMNNEKIQTRFTKSI